ELAGARGVELRERGAGFALESIHDVRAAATEYGRVIEERARHLEHVLAPGDVVERRLPASFELGERALGQRIERRTPVPGAHDRDALLATEPVDEIAGDDVRARRRLA